MSQATLTQLVHRLQGPESIGFFLVLARVTPLFILAPLFSSKMIPRRVRAIVAVALAVGMTGIATRGQTIPTDPLQVLGLMIVSLLVGLGFALAVGVVFAAVQAAGALTDAVAGFSFGQQVDPINGNQGGVLTQLYGLVGVALFVGIGGDAWVLRGLGRTFEVVPLTRGARINSLVAGSTQAVAAIFTSAVEVAAPALLALVITDIAFGMVSRVVPQLNVFAVGFPVKVGVALLIVAATLPFLAGWLWDQTGGAVTGALHMLSTG